MAQDPNPSTEPPAYPIPELRYDTDAYRKQKKAYTYRTIGNIISGQGPAKTKDREELIQGYYDLLVNLDDAQKELLIEVEKTGRIAQTNFANLIGHFAKVRAASEAARGGVISARTQAGSANIDRLNKEVKDFGAKSQNDLTRPDLESAAKLNQWVEGGRITDSNAFGQEVTAHIKELTVTDPTLVVPYLQKIQTETDVNLMPIIMQTASGQPVGDNLGIPSNVLSEMAGAAKFGIEEHKQGMDFNTQKYGEMATEAENMASDMGWAGAKTLFNDLKIFVDRAPGMLDSGASGVSVEGNRIPPAPKADASFDEKAAWVQQALGGRGELRSDGNVYEIGNSFNPAEGQQSMPFDMTARLFGNPAGYKMLLSNSGPSFINDSRTRLIAKIKELETSDLPDYVMTRNAIIRNPLFKDWMVKRGYIDSDGQALLDNKTLFKYYVAEHMEAAKQRKQYGEGKQLLNMANNPDMPVNLQDRAAAKRKVGETDLGADAEGYSDLPEKEDTPSAGSTITAGAEGPDKAASITEESAARGDPKRDSYREFADYKDIAEGREPWKYRVYDNGKIEVIAKPGSTEVSPDKPMTVKAGSRAYSSIRTMADTPQAQAIAEAAGIEMDAPVMDMEENKISAKGVEEKAPGMIKPGNVDLKKQPKVPNPNGGVSTVFSSSHNIDGQEVLLPAVTPDGRFLNTDDEVIAEYEKTGLNLGTFDSPESATAYADQLHKDYENGVYEPEPSNPEAEEDMKGDLTDIADEERVAASNKGEETEQELAAREERGGQFETPIEATPGTTDPATVDTGVPDPNAPVAAPAKTGGLLGFLKGLKSKPEDEGGTDNTDAEDAARKEERKKKKEGRIEEVGAAAANQAELLGNLTPEQIARRERRLKLLRGEAV